MARPHKQMPGESYHYYYDDELKVVVVDCTYLCPYCNEMTSSSFDTNADNIDLLESGGFFEPLTCDLCGKVTDVRFWKNNRI